MDKPSHQENDMELEATRSDLLIEENESMEITDDLFLLDIEEKLSCYIKKMEVS